MTTAPDLTVEAEGGRIEVRPGEVVAALGPRAEAAVLGAIGARAGSRTTLGARVLRGGTAHRVRAGLGIVRDVPVAARQPVRDHLVPGVGRESADRLLATTPLLAGRGDDPAGVLSGGERTVLAWLRCLAGDPEAVVLVHPAAGLDEPTLAWTARTVAAWTDAGTAVLVLPDRPESAAWAHRAVTLG